MRRSATLAVFLGLILLALALGVEATHHQRGPMQVQIIGSGGQLATMDADGKLATTATMGPIDSLRHISSVTHVAAASTLPVNCVTGCAGSSGQVIAHVSSVTHVGGTLSLVNRAGIYATLTGSSLDVNCTAGCAGGGGDSVNVFHQSTVAHISSVTHVAGGVQIQNQAGTQRVVVTSTAGGALQVECAAGCGTPTEPATFYAYFDRIAPAQNKYMATLFNTSATRKVVVRRIWWLTNNFTAVTGVVHDMYLARITARTAGTSVTVRARDSNDLLSSGITADTGSTSVTEAYIARRFVGASEESPVTTTALPTYNDRQGTRLYEKPAGEKGETLRQNQGLTIRTLTASTVGVLSFLIEFTDEN